MLTDALGQGWPPFVLVIGLLLVGQVANDDGLFVAFGARIARTPLSPPWLLVAALALVAAVTAVLNLDTSVVFLTPALVHAARRHGLDERPFLYGAVYMSNSASLLLPGSNLTNLLVLNREHVTGLAFAEQMLPAWIVSCVLTAAFLVAVFRPGGGCAPERRPSSIRPGIGAASVLLAAAAVLALGNPALPVLAIGVAAIVLSRRRPAINLQSVTVLFGLTVLLGVIGRAYHGPAELIDHAGRWPTALLATLSANLVNNLPAAVLFAAQAPPHPRALLLGLDLGPNLAVTGSLSAYLWFQAAKAAGSRPSIRSYSLLGLALVPLTLAAALAACSVSLPV
jgi:arsenical pump membrane protein